jgi:hypothetical protein
MIKVIMMTIISKKCMIRIPDPRSSSKWTLWSNIGVVVVLGMMIIILGSCSYLH